MSNTPITSLKQRIEEKGILKQAARPATRQTSTANSVAKRPPSLGLKTRIKLKLPSIKPFLSKPPGKKSGLFLIMFFVIVAISVLGLVMILSASSHTALQTKGSSWFWFQRQIIWFALGWAALILTLRIDYHFLKHLAKPLMIISGILLFLVLVPKVGVSANGASRWIGVGPLTVQPVELAKLSLVIYFAQLLDSRKNRLNNIKLSIIPVIAILCIFEFLILLQPDLGSGIILGLIAFAVLFVAGVPMAPLSVWASGSIGITFLLSFMASYRRRRFLAFLDPWDDPLDTGYQTIQSLVAVSSGGFLGRGLGSGRAKWGYLPHAHTDFIFAVVAEELGLLGAAALLLAFSALCIGGILTALRAPDLLGAVLAGGITMWIATQVFLNVGAAVGSLPITGVPLPLVSFGGSSLVITMAGLGILLNVARFSGTNKRK